MLAAGEEPRILLLAPITPAPSGNGLAMRAALAVRGLSRVGELWTAVVPVAGPAPDASGLAWAAERSARAVAVSLPEPRTAVKGWLEHSLGREIVAAAGALPTRARLASPSAGRAALAALEQDDFDAVYVLRLYLAGAAVPLIEGSRRPLCLVDADDDDYETARSIGALHELRGESAAARRAEEDAEALDRLAGGILPRFDAIFAAGAPDVVSLAKRHQLEGRVHLLPNGVELPAAPVGTPTAGGDPRLLFVGNLDYVPNRDAVEHLAERVLPLLRRRHSGSRLDVVGGGGASALHSLRNLPGVELHGAAETLDPYYRGATVVAVPLRAGGGSRLKLLEAFAMGVPVVATPVAAAGLEVEDERELLLAGSEHEMVEAIDRLAGEPELGPSLAARARRFVAEHHEVEGVAEQLSARVEASLVGSSC